MGIFNFQSLDLVFLILLFLGIAAIIAITGVYLTRYADQLADKTGLGEAAVGAILLGAVTSLSGTITSVSAAVKGFPDLALSNSIGGIAAQTTFLAVGDLIYRKANLEHAAASISNLLYGVLLVTLMTELLMIQATPDFTIFKIHPGMIAVLFTYFAGLRLVSSAEKSPMWNPKKTRETVFDVPEEKNKDISLPVLIGKFTVCALTVGVAGYFVAETGIAISVKTGFSASFVGALFTATATSLPELIVTISSIRQGALTLAVGNILGGNTFDVIMVPLADTFYREGSLVHDAGSSSTFIVTLSAFLTTILLLGLIHRQEQGPVKIGWESFVVLLAFAGGYVILFFTG